MIRNRMNLNFFTAFKRPTNAPLTWNLFATHTHIHILRVGKERTPNEKCDVKNVKG